MAPRTVFTLLAALLGGHSRIIARIRHPRCDYRARSRSGARPPAAATREVPSLSRPTRKTAGGKLIPLKDSACRSDNKWEESPQRQSNSGSSSEFKRSKPQDSAPQGPTADQFDHLPSQAGDHGRGIRGRYTELPVPSNPPCSQSSQFRGLLHNSHTKHAVNDPARGTSTDLRPSTPRVAGIDCARVSRTSELGLSRPASWRDRLRSSELSL